MNRNLTQSTRLIKQWLKPRKKLLGLLLLFVGAVSWSALQQNESGPRNEEPSRAAFEQDGSVRLPQLYRRWAHVGSRYKASGTNILDGSPVVTPQIMNTYVEPSALDYYKRTGKWVDGAQIVKELSNIRVGKDCDSITHICSSPIGPGIFQETYIGLGMMVKDRKRFPDAPGNWGYFAFLRTNSMYPRLAQLRPQSQCATCHVKLVSDTDYVFARAHLGLAPENVQ